MFKRISILGSTGSIGTQTLDIVRKKREHFGINFLSAGQNIDLLNKQCNEFSPKGVVINDKDAFDEFKAQSNFRGKILYGIDGLNEAASFSDNNLIVSSLVGFAGVEPTLAAIHAGIDVALANKETLVSAGHLITGEAKKYNVQIIAVDSEHNAILQCLAGEAHKAIEKIILTASGGPFRELDIEKFKHITVEDALNHPNWSMGKKITIDSATMMNKGFEIIEAKWLFDLDISKIDVLIHPQSIIHSLVQFKDASFKAQLGLPDMRIPISYALSWPERMEVDLPVLDLSEIARFDFHKPDSARYPCLGLAYRALEMDGAATAILNAANEVAVDLFLNGLIPFTEISNIIAETLDSTRYMNGISLEGIIESDNEARRFAKSLITTKVN